MKLNPEKFGLDYFKQILVTRTPIHWVKNANLAFILEHLWIINVCKETLRPVNRYTLI